MWNTTENNSSTVFNAPATGIIQKSNKNSYFVRMHQNSELAKEIFNDKPIYRDKEIVVLQVLLTHEGWFLIELVSVDKM